MKAEKKESSAQLIRQLEKRVAELTTALKMLLYADSNRSAIIAVQNAKAVVGDGTETKTN